MNKIVRAIVYEFGKYSIQVVDLATNERIGVPIEVLSLKDARATMPVNAVKISKNILRGECVEIWW